MSLQISDGRPPQDCQFQNLKSVSTFVASKLTANEVNSNVVIAGEVVADGASINNLSVENITVTNPGTLVPFPQFIALPLSVAVVSGATYSATSAPAILYNNLTDTVVWNVYVPGSSTQLKVYVPMKAALGSSALTVNVNGTVHAVAAASLKTGTSFVYNTSAFDWQTSGIMSVVIKSDTATLEIGDAPYISF